MNWVFVAGDVGGARALAPIFEELRRCGQVPQVVETGTLPALIGGDSPRLSVERACSVFGAGLVFATSVCDDDALRVARAYAEEGLPTVHVLDHWSNYTQRLISRDGARVRPTAYLVMDELARDAAAEAGIDASSIVVTGHPGFADLERLARAPRPQSRLAPNGRILVAFLSEPVQLDQGLSAANPNYRGYTERDVLRLVCEALQPLAGTLWVGLVPHPREDTQGLVRSWEEHRGRLQGGHLAVASGREAVLAAQGVIGMATVLLYEAWLLGRPVLSVQPGLRVEALRAIGRRAGVVLIDRTLGAEARIEEWGRRALQPGKRRGLRPELERHTESAGAAVAVLDELRAGRGAQ